MDKIRIWFKDEFYSKYFENVTNWEFEDGFLKITNNEGVWYVATVSIHYMIIGEQEAGNEH